VQAPLNEYLRDSCKNDRWAIAWTHTAEEAFNKYKDALSAQLSYPSDPASDETHLICDVSDFAMERSLSNIWIIHRNLSHSSLASLARRNEIIMTISRKLMAIFEAVKYFHYFIEGRVFRMVTDHR